MLSIKVSVYVSLRKYLKLTTSGNQSNECLPPDQAGAASRLEIERVEHLHMLSMRSLMSFVVGYIVSQRGQKVTVTSFTSSLQCDTIHAGRLLLLFCVGLSLA